MYHVPLYQAPPVRRMRRWTRWSERLTILCLCKEGKGDLQVAFLCSQRLCGSLVVERECFSPLHH